MYRSVVTHLPEDGRISGRHMYEVHSVYNTSAYTHVHLLVSAIIFNCSMRGYSSIKTESNRAISNDYDTVEYYIFWTVHCDIYT